MSEIKIVPAETGALVRSYSNSEFGYVVLESSDLVFGNGWIREAKRTCLLRAKTALLAQFAAQARIAGRIQVLEYLENAVPAAVQKAQLRDDIPWTEAIATFIKKAGSDGPALKIGDAKILRFTQYDPAGQSVDIILQHDTVLEVDAYKAKKGQSGDDASLPGGDEPVAPF